MTSSEQSHNIYNYISDHYVLITTAQSFDDAWYQLEQKSGDWDWYLLIKQPTGSVLGSNFRDIYNWKKQHSLIRVDLDKLLKDPDTPLRAINTVDEASQQFQKLINSTTKKNEEIFVVTWCGEITGIFSQQLQLCNNQRDNGNTKSIVARIFSSYKKIDRRSVKTIDVIRSSLPIAIISIVIGILIAYVTLKTTDFSEIFPEQFPPTMTGEWNVLVTGFSPVGENSIFPKEASYISDVFYNHLKTELEVLGDELGVSVQLLGPGKTARISGATPEEREKDAAYLATKTKADIVIYGTIQGTDNVLLLTPEFFVNVRNFFDAEEIVGQHTLGNSIELFTAGEDTPTQIVLNKELSRRSKILALVSQGLGMYLTHRYEDALEMFSTANANDLWQFNEGREVVYLFEGNAAGKAELYEQSENVYKRALELNPEYARAYAGLGSVYYLYSLVDETPKKFDPNQDYLDMALNYYQSALQAKVQPESANIPIKVALGMGQVYLVKWLSGSDTLDQAKVEFQYVIDEYDLHNNKRVEEQAAEAYARMGLISRQQGLPLIALENYTTAIDLSTSPERRAILWYTIGDINHEDGNFQDGKVAYLNAIEQYKSAISLTTQPSKRAEYWLRIADCYEKIGDKVLERSAIGEAVNNLPLGSTEREEAEARLRQYTP